MYNEAQELYLESLTSAWKTDHVRHPSLWLARDPEAEEKMLRDAIIGHAVQHRCHLIAGREWTCNPRADSDPRAELAVAVATELIGGIKKFSEARKQLARAFFHGSRYALIHRANRVLTIGDGRPRQWVVPVRLEDQSTFRYRKKMEDPSGNVASAHWQRYEILGPRSGTWVDVTTDEAVGCIGHVYDDSEETLGYGKGLRESLGWPWYALTHVNQEAIGAIERYARGWVMAKVHGAAHAETSLPNSEVITAWKNKLEAMQSRHVLVMTKDDEVDVLSGSGVGWQMIDQFVQRMERTIMTLVLSANLPTGADQGGSYAMADIQEGSTESLVQFDRQGLEEALTDDLLGAIWYWNWSNLVELGIQEAKPRFSIAQEKREDPEKVVMVAAQAHGMGVDLSANDFYDRTGLKKPDPGEEIIPGADMTGGGGFGGMPGGDPGFGGPFPPGAQFRDGLHSASPGPYQQGNFATDAPWREELHPRKKDGKFAPKGQGEGKAGPRTKEPETTDDDPDPGSRTSPRTRKQDRQITAARKALGDKLAEKIARRGDGDGRRIDLSVDEADKVLNVGILGFVSAGPNPEEKGKVSDDFIEERYKKLQADLQDRGFQYVPVKGKYGEEEDSFLVLMPEADKPTLLELGKKYNQESVIYSVGEDHELIYTMGEKEGLAYTGKGFNRLSDEAEDFWTEFCGQPSKKSAAEERECFKFTLVFDFERLTEAKLKDESGRVWRIQFLDGKPWRFKEWDESKHPRRGAHPTENDGQFVPKAEGGGATSEPHPQEKDDAKPGIPERTWVDAQDYTYGDIEVGDVVSTGQSTYTIKKVSDIAGDKVAVTVESDTGKRNSFTFEKAKTLPKGRLRRGGADAPVDPKAWSPKLGEKAWDRYNEQVVVLTQSGYDEGYRVRVETTTGFKVYGLKYWDLLPLDEAEDRTYETFGKPQDGILPGTITVNRAEFEAIKDYTGSWYTGINRMLRTGKATKDDTEASPAEPKFLKKRRQQYAEKIEVLDGLIAKNRAGQSKVFGASVIGDAPEVYRGTKASHFGLDTIADLKEGQVLRNHAYISTSKDPGMARDFARNYFSAEDEDAPEVPSHFVMRVNLSPESRGADVAGISGHKHEAEILLSRHSEFVIKKIHKNHALGSTSKGQMWIIDVDHRDATPDPEAETFKQWDESKHPRRRDGRFAPKGQGETGGGKPKDAPASEAPKGLPKSTGPKALPDKWWSGDEQRSVWDAIQEAAPEAVENPGTHGWVIQDAFVKFAKDELGAGIQMDTFESVWDEPEKFEQIMLRHRVEKLARTLDHLRTLKAAGTVMPKRVVFSVVPFIKRMGERNAKDLLGFVDPNDGGEKLYINPLHIQNSKLKEWGELLDVEMTGDKDKDRNELLHAVVRHEMGHMAHINHLKSIDKVYIGFEPNKTEELPKGVGRIDPDGWLHIDKPGKLAMVWAMMFIGAPPRHHLFTFSPSQAAEVGAFNSLNKISQAVNAAGDEDWVSPQGRRSPAEFVAEVFQKAQRGETVPESIKTWYDKVGGAPW